MFGIRTKRDLILENEMLHKQLAQLMDRPKTAAEIIPSVNEHFVKQLTQLSETVLEHGNLLKTYMSYSIDLGSRMQHLEKFAASPTPIPDLAARLAALEAKTDGHGNALEMAAIDHEVLVKLTDMLDIDVVPRNADEAVDLVPRTKKGSK